MELTENELLPEKKDIQLERYLFESNFWLRSEEKAALQLL